MNFLVWGILNIIKAARVSALNIDTIENENEVEVDLIAISISDYKEDEKTIWLWYKSKRRIKFR
jgi:hypothetical protein